MFKLSQAKALILLDRSKDGDVIGSRLTHCQKAN